MNDNDRNAVFSQEARGAASQLWATPRDLIAYLENTEYPMGLDAAALHRSAVCPNYFGPDHEDPDRRDAFKLRWADHVPRDQDVWLNPPYTKKTIDAWFDKVIQEVHHLGGMQRIWVLVPARTSNAWFFDKVMNEPTCVEVHFIRGRLKYLDPETMEPVLDKSGRPQCAPFPSMLLAYSPVERMRSAPLVRALEL